MNSENRHAGAPIIVRVPTSHLYPGVHLRADKVSFNRLPDTELFLLFADGSSTMAGFRQEQAGRLLLEVAAYTTASGTYISTRSWPVVAIVDKGDGVDVHLGRRHNR